MFIKSPNKGSYRYALDIAAVFSAACAGISSVLAKCGIKKTDSDVATALRTPVVLVFAWAAVFAALTSIFAKVGISGVESNPGTAIRTGVVPVMAFVMIFARGKHKLIKETDKGELLFILLSGVATGASRLCYYYAIAHGDVSVVVPIDKMSVTVTVIFSYFVFKEKLPKKSLVGLCMMIAGTLLMTFFKQCGSTADRIEFSCFDRNEQFPRQAQNYEVNVEMRIKNGKKSYIEQQSGVVACSQENERKARNLHEVLGGT